MIEVAPERVVELADQAHDDAERDRVEAGERLVVEDQLRIERDRRAPAPRAAPCRPRARSASAARRRAGRPRRSFIITRSLHQLLGQVGVLAQREGDVLEHRQVGEQRAELEQHAHLAAHREQAVAVELARRRGRARAPCRRSACSAPMMMRSSVVLPQPDWPMMPTTEPRGMARRDVAQHRARGVVAERHVADLDDGSTASGGRRLRHGVILSPMTEAIRNGGGARSARSSSATAASRRSAASISRSPRARRSAWSARTAPARPRSSAACSTLPRRDAGTIELFGVAPRRPARRRRLAYLPGALRAAALPARRGVPARHARARRRALRRARARRGCSTSSSWSAARSSARCAACPRA